MRQCPYCEAMNAEDVKYCETCGIPQASEVGVSDIPPPPPRPKGQVVARLRDPVARYVAIGAGAVVLIGLAFGLGRLTSGSEGVEDFAAEAVPSTTAEPTLQGQPATTAPAITTTTTTTTTIPIGFDDVDTNTPFAEAIDALTELGVRVGCNPPANTLFCPNDPVTRGQMASLLVGALGYTDEGSADLFSDDDGTTFEDDIQRVAIAGITKGCNPPDNDLFCPDRVVTRGQAATFLVRAFEITRSADVDLLSDDNGSSV